MGVYSMSFFDQLFNPLSAELPDSKAYLDRIGMEPVQKPDKATLDALILAHQRNVPFENLDVYDVGGDLPIDIPSLFDKVVTRRRGGYCFELNAVFMALLESLGYDCYPIAVRVMMGATRVMPISHRAIVVTIDGVRYFADVGFGGPSPQSALLLDDLSDQPSGTNVFFFEKDHPQGTMLYRRVDGGKETVLLFRETPADPVDFIALNEYQSKSKTSGFVMGRMLNKVTETGNITLNANVLKINTTGGDAVEKTIETEDELRRALEEHYGLKVDFPLKMD